MIEKIWLVVFAKEFEYAEYSVFDDHGMAMGYALSIRDLKATDTDSIDLVEISFLTGTPVVMSTQHIF